MDTRERGSLGARFVRLLADERFQIAALLLLALLVRLAFHFRSPAFVGKDSQSYFLPGWAMARGEAFEMGQRRTPGYPLFIAGVVLTLGEELRSLALAQHLLGVATVGATYFLGRLTFGRSAALLAGAMVALSGPLLIYERYVMSEALFSLALALALLAAVAAVRSAQQAGSVLAVVRSPVVRLWLISGLALGAAVLTRPVAQVLIPLLGLGALVAGGRRWRLGVAGLVALLVGVAIFQGPWVVRNALVTGNASASTFGRTLIARTAYYDRGFVFDVPGQPDPDPRMQRAGEIVQEGAKQRQSDGIIAGRLRAELTLGPVEVNRVMRDIAVSAILRNPEHYVSGTLAFAWEIFAGLEERLRDHWDEYKDANPWDPRIRDLVGGPSPAELAERSNANRLVQIYQPARYSSVRAVLVLLGVVLACLVGRYRSALLPAGAAVALLLISAALNGPVERYRYPVDPLISVVAAGGLTGAVALLWSLAGRIRHTTQLDASPLSSSPRGSLGRAQEPPLPLGEGGG